MKGNVGTSPITGAANLLSCSEVTGRIISVDATGPSPCSLVHPALLGHAISDMQTAYTDAAGRTPDVSELGGGQIGGLTIPPGVYSWSGNVTISSNVTLQGTKKDVWIFQVAQDVDIAAATAVMLSGGARPHNIYWQVAGKVTMGTTAHFEGTILAKTSIAMLTGASINGRLLAQTAVTLQKNVVTFAR
ncbi:MAG TPA: ice-binding family protein [Candidatus Methylacidiphilales bacterium]